MSRKQQEPVAAPVPASQAEVPPRLDTEAGLIDALAQTSYVIMAMLSRVGAEHDLSLTQLRVLGILQDRRLRMAALADYLGLEKSTLSGLVDRAEKRGLLARTTSPDDGRAVDVSITAAGTSLAGSAHGQFARLIAPLVAELTPVERRRLQALLERMLRAG